MDEQQLMQILQMLAGSAPNEGFGVQPPQDGGRLGMSEDAQFMGQGLNAMQGQGFAPLMPEEAGSGPAAEMILMQLLQALREQDLGQRGMAPDPRDNMMNGGAALGSDQNTELLKALLSGS